VIQTIDKPTVDLEGLRKAVQEEYALVARDAGTGARKATSDEEWQRALAALTCEVAP